MAEKTAAQLQQYLKTRVAIDPETGCWNWLGFLNRDGYGQCRVGRRIEYTHRLAHAVFKGPIPRGLHVDHRCSNRRCCNPDHLEAVEQQENNRRAAARKRAHAWAKRLALEPLLPGLFWHSDVECAPKQQLVRPWDQRKYVLLLGGSASARQRPETGYTTIYNCALIILSTYGGDCYDHHSSNYVHQQRRPL